MNKDEALKMAIETLETAEIQSEYDGLSNIIFKAINACKEALEQLAQEPVGQLCLGCGTSMTDARLDAEKRHNAQLISCCADRQMVDVYTHPYQWQGLTDDEIDKIVVNSETLLAKDIARAIEQALKEKNT
jgi:hypothetical protein